MIGGNMPRNNIRFIDVAELILAKRKEQDAMAREQKTHFEQSLDTLAWLIALGISLTVVLLVVASQEGWW
jgi:hypothetical protein